MKHIDDLKYWNLVKQSISELRLPGTIESVSYGTPSFKVKTAFLCRLLEDGKTLVLHSDDRDEVMSLGEEEVYFVTEHYRNYPYVLVRLDKIKRKDLTVLLLKSWKEIASSRLLKEWERSEK
jgi:hypothetical protein